MRTLKFIVTNQIVIKDPKCDFSGLVPGTEEYLQADLNDPPKMVHRSTDNEAVTASANAAKTLSELANNLPNSGGLAGLFAGENDLSMFADQLIPFGEAIKAYANVVSGIDAEAVA